MLPFPSSDTALAVSLPLPPHVRDHCVTPFGPNLLRTKSRPPMLSSLEVETTTTPPLTGSSASPFTVVSTELVLPLPENILTHNKSPPPLYLVSSSLRCSPVPGLKTCLPAT